MPKNTETLKQADLFIKLIIWAIILFVIYACGVTVKLMPREYHYVTEIAFAGLMLFCSFRFGEGHIFRDIREIALYDLIFQVFCFLIDYTTYYNDIYRDIKGISYGFFALYAWRIFFRARKNRGTVFVGWPIFGILGLIEWLKDREKFDSNITNPTVRQRLIVYLGIALCFPFGVVLSHSDIGFLGLGIIYTPALLAIGEVKEVLAFFKKVIDLNNTNAQALEISQAQKVQFDAKMIEITDELADKEARLVDLIAVEGELVGALATIVADMSEKERMHNDVELALFETQARVDELLEDAQAHLLLPGAAELVDEYRKIHEAKRAGFVRMAKSLALQSPNPGNFKLHLVEPLAKQIELAAALTNEEAVEAIADDQQSL